MAKEKTEGSMVNNDKEAIEAAGAKKRAHKATYATDKRKGGYLIRVEGPQAAAFVGREVPVTTKDGAEHNEKLTKLIWSGVDTDNGKPIGLYGFESKPRAVAEQIQF